MKRKTFNSRFIRAVIILFLSVSMASVSSCSDFNFFSAFKNYQVDIDNASAEGLLNLLENEDVAIYLFQNKDKRENLLERIRVEQEGRRTGEVLLYQMASIRIIMDATVLRNVPQSFFQNLKTRVFSETAADVDLASFAFFNLNSLYGQGETYIRDYIDATLLLHGFLRSFAATLKPDTVEFPAKFESSIGFYVNAALFSGAQNLLYRWHRVIDLTGNIRVPVCKPGAVGCEDVDDYKDVLIRHLLERTGYENIFILQIKDYEPPALTAGLPGFSFKQTFLSEGFLYDGATRFAGNNEFSVIFDAGGQTDLTELFQP